MSMQQTVSCSESRIRSRTSRGVPEWSVGKELYIGSAVSAIGRVSAVTGIVPGPPEGSRGSTGWGHLSQRAPRAEVGGEPAPGGLVGPPWAPLRLGLGTLGEGAPPLALGGTPPPLATAPLRDPISRAGAPLGAYIKEGGGGRAAAPPSKAQPSPPQHLSSSVVCLAKPCRSTASPPPPCRRAAAGAFFLNLSFPLAGSRRRRRLPSRTCVERGGAVRSALGHR